MPMACLAQRPPFPGPLLLDKARGAGPVFCASLWQQGSELKEGLGCELTLLYLGSAWGELPSGGRAEPQRGAPGRVGKVFLWSS